MITIQISLHSNTLHLHSLKYGAARKREILRKEEEVGRSIATLEKCLTDEIVIENQQQKVWSDL